MDNKNKILILMISSLLLNSCGNINTNSQKETQAIKEKKQELSNNLKSNVDNYKNNNDKSLSKKIKISERCIGCWRCTMVDPAHFKVNMQTFTPDIISQENINSEAVSKAIDVCPVDAISIS